MNTQNSASALKIQTIRVREVARQDYKFILSLLLLIRRAK